MQFNKSLYAAIQLRRASEGLKAQNVATQNQ